MTDTAPTGTVREIAAIPTAHAPRYLGQLCKHFAHKLPVELDEAFTTGSIRFAIGTCNVAANDSTLTLDLAATPGDMPQLEDVVVRHLVRFAFREELPIEWRAA